MAPRCLYNLFSPAISSMKASSTAIAVEMYPNTIRLPVLYFIVGFEFLIRNALFVLQHSSLRSADSKRLNLFPPKNILLVRRVWSSTKFRFVLFCFFFLFSFREIIFILWFTLFVCNLWLLSTKISDVPCPDKTRDC